MSEEEIVFTNQSYYYIFILVSFEITHYVEKLCEQIIQTIETEIINKHNV